MLNTCINKHICKISWWGGYEGVGGFHISISMFLPGPGSSPVSPFPVHRLVVDTKAELDM